MTLKRRKPTLPMAIYKPSDYMTHIIHRDSTKKHPCYQSGDGTRYYYQHAQDSQVHMLPCNATKYFFDHEYFPSEEQELSCRHKINIKLRSTKADPLIHFPAESNRPPIESNEVIRGDEENNGPEGKMQGLRPAFSYM